MKNLQNEDQFVKSLSNQMQSILNCDYDIDVKRYLIDYIYVYKVCQWNFTDENLKKLNNVYDICMDILKRNKHA